MKEQKLKGMEQPAGAADRTTVGNTYSKGEYQEAIEALQKVFEGMLLH